MNVLLKKAGFMQGAREEFLRRGYSETDALRLTKLAYAMHEYQSYPEMFTDGFIEIRDSVNKKVTDKKKKSAVKKLLPLVLGAGIGGLVLTPFGHKVIKYILGPEGERTKIHDDYYKPMLMDVDINEYSKGK